MSFVVHVASDVMSEPARTRPSSPLGLTRRHVVIALPWTASAAFKPLADGVKPATAISLLTLRPLWQETLAAFGAVLCAKTPIEQRCFARQPLYPDRSCFGLDGGYQAAQTQFDAAVAAIELEEGLTENQRLEILAMDTYHAIVDRIIAAPARSLSDLLFKAEVSQSFMHTHEDLARSIVEDCLALLGDTRPPAATPAEDAGSAGRREGIVVLP